MKLLAALLLVASLVAVPRAVSAADCPAAYKEIPLERLEAMFSQMRTQTKWNVDGPMKWGYFFFDPEREKLARFAAEQESSGYKVIELFKGGPMYTLHLERVEAHTPKSLFERNAQLGGPGYGQLPKNLRWLRRRPLNAHSHRARAVA